jgi:hypothetical protein
MNKRKMKYLMASLDIENELITCGEYKVVSERRDEKGNDYYTVINELKEEKEYPEDYFDLECK